MQLHILSPGMEKRRTNTTRYDGRMQTLQWHVEWRFPAAAGAKAVDHKCAPRCCACWDGVQQNGADRAPAAAEPGAALAALSCGPPVLWR